MLLIFCYVDLLWGIVGVFVSFFSVFSEIIYDMFGISIITCYGKYYFPFFFFRFFCDRECYHSIYI